MKKCRRCSKPATLHITEMREDEVHELHLCETCYQEYLDYSESPDGSSTSDPSPEVAIELTDDQTLEELDEAREWMLTLGRKSAGEKVASFLFLIAAHIDPELDAHEGPIQFELPLKRSDIADFLGLTIETVSRQITKLRKAGVIEVENNRTVIVPDLERLRSACERDD